MHEKHPLGERPQDSESTSQIQARPDPESAGERSTQGGLAAVARPRVAGSILVAAGVASGLLALGSGLLVQAGEGARLVARAVLPADSFAPGPTSGQQLGSEHINGRQPPFVNRQPIQGFSAVLDEKDGSFLVMSDNGFGSLENSADYRLRLYRIRPDFETPLAELRRGGSGEIDVEDLIQLSDPARQIPFAITEEFTAERFLTGADFDIESVQRAPDGSLFFGDEFGPFLLHTDEQGHVLEPPIPLPDFGASDPDREIRSPQNPLNEEASAVRVMNAVRDHARRNGNPRAPVFSPFHVMLVDGNPATFVDSREHPPAGSGVAPAASEIFDVASLQAAGYPVVPYTINDVARMQELIALGVNGIISDRPDILFDVVARADPNGDGIPGDFLDADGLIDPSRFDAQGHRGGRNLRPENTLPAMEAGLDFLMSTLETDTGLTSDRVLVLDHDPFLNSQKCRRADGRPYGPDDEILIRSLTAAQLQTQFICDKVFRGPSQSNDRSLSPVAVAFASQQGLADPYSVPTLQQLFDFVAFYRDFYATGPGSTHPAATERAANAARVRFNIETKLNPRKQFRDRTFGPDEFVGALGGAIERNSLESRADVQSFDFRTLLGIHERFPRIRTVCLFGDFPIFADPAVPGSDDGTNLQDEDGANTPWLAGLLWPYRVTAASASFRAARSGGFEGMAISPSGRSLLPLLERPLVGDDPGSLLIHVFDIRSRRYTGERFRYPLDPRGSAIGDFVLYSSQRGLVIERDGTQGDLDGFKQIFEIELRRGEELVGKRLAVDLLELRDPFRISLPAAPGDVGLGRRFAFPFVTIEDVVVLGPRRIGVLNDNNYPFSVGRHVGSGEPDDNEFIVVDLDRPLTQSFLPLALARLRERLRH